MAPCLPGVGEMNGSAAQRSPDFEDAPRALTLLVVDDDQAWREALKESLDRDGFRTTLLARADWVVKAVDFHRPDVVILDINLPGGNGLDVLSTLMRRWPSLPVMIMTAFGGARIGSEARRRGAAAYLEKPFRMATLVDEIRRIAPASDSPQAPA